MLVVGLAVLHILFSLPFAAGGGFFIIPVNPIKFEGVKIHHVYWTNKKPDVIIHSVRCYRNGRRLVPFSLGGTLYFLFPLLERRVVLMVTYAELFQYSLVLIGIISLVLAIKKK